jgi:CMP-N-acetylneuraminic acid synthetase
MIELLRVIAVVPARGGSKGVPLKNLRKVNGLPIVTLAGKVASQVSYIDRAVVSTDHEDIATAGEKGGLVAPFRRPRNLSGDRVADLQVLSHALLTMEELDGVRYDVVVMLQPTSPMRTVKHVAETIEMLVRERLDAVWTVSETESKAHPLKQLTVVDGKLDYYDPKGKEVIARQQLQPVYHRNGLAYAISRDCLLSKGSIKGDRTGAVVCEGDFISIDTEFDFKLTNFLLKNDFVGSEGS